MLQLLAFLVSASVVGGMFDLNSNLGSDTQAAGNTSNIHLILSGPGWIQSVGYTGNAFYLRSAGGNPQAISTFSLFPDHDNQRLYAADYRGNEAYTGVPDSPSGIYNGLYGKVISTEGVGFLQLGPNRRDEPRILMGAGPASPILVAMNVQQEGQLSLNRTINTTEVINNLGVPQTPSPTRILIDPSKSYFVVLIANLQTILLINIHDLQVAGSYTMPVDKWTCSLRDGVFWRPSEANTPWHFIALCQDNAIITSQALYNATGLFFDFQIVNSALTYGDALPPANRSFAVQMALGHRPAQSGVVDLYVSHIETGNETDFVTHIEMHDNQGLAPSLQYKGLYSSRGLDPWGLALDADEKTLFVMNSKIAGDHAVITALPRNVWTGQLDPLASARWMAKDLFSFAGAEAFNQTRGPSFLTVWTP